MFDIKEIVEFLENQKNNYPLGSLLDIIIIIIIIILIAALVLWFIRMHERNKERALKHNLDKDNNFLYKIKSGWPGQTLKPIFKPDQPLELKATVEGFQKTVEGVQKTVEGLHKDLEILKEKVERKGKEDSQRKEDGDSHSPLEQFSIHPFIPMKMGKFYFSFTNSSLFMLLTLGLVLLILFFVTKKGGGKLVPNAWQSLVELIYDFVLNLVNEQIGGLDVKQKFFPCILVTFTFLLFCNLQGMIPFSFTVTSHFLITLALSFSILIGITIVGFQRHGLHFFSLLLPAGVPLPLAPFLVLLELISYCFRALSLGIRLFANMMAGHSLVKILSGFAWTMLLLNNLLFFIGDLGPLFIVLALTGLELGVAILQAYVFTILICIYLNDAINLH